MLAGARYVDMPNPRRVGVVGLDRIPEIATARPRRGVRPVHRIAVDPEPWRIHGGGPFAGSRVERT